MSQGRGNDINTKRYSYSITVLRNGIFLVASQEIICNSGRQQTKSLTKILDENALEYLASRKGFILDRLRLDILTIIFTRIFNYNLSVISVCSVDFFQMSQGQVIDIMTYNSYSFTVLQFLKRKNSFRILKTRGQVSVSWTITLGVWSMFL